MRWYFVIELFVVGTLAGLLTVAAPHHPVAAIAAPVLAWVVLQAVSAWHFMFALYHGNVIESGSRPHRYSTAPRAKVNWYARRFMLCYLNVSKETRWRDAPVKPAKSVRPDQAAH